MKTLATLLAALVLTGLALPSAAAQNLEVVEAYATPPGVSNVRISPSGTRLLMVTGGVEDGVVIVTTLDGSQSNAISLNGEPFYSIDWLNDDYFLIIFAQRRHVNSGGDRADVGRLLGVRFDGAHRYELSQYMFGIESQAFDDPEHVYMLGWHVSDSVESGIGFANRRNAVGGAMGIFQLDIATGNTHLVQRGTPDVSDYFLGPDSRATVQVRFDREDQQIRIRHRPTGQTQWRFVYQERLERVFRGRDSWEYLGTMPSPMGIDPTGRYLYFHYRGASGRREVSRFDMETREVVGPVYASPIADVRSSVRDRRTNAIVGIAWNEGREVYEWIDPEFGQVYNQVQSAFPDSEIDIVNYDGAFNRIVIHREAGGSSGAYYLLDRGAGTLRLISRTRPLLPDSEVNPVEVITYRSRDGLDIMAYLTLPHDRPHRNLPLVVLPHGGPEARDYYGFDDWAQMLAGEGYAVVQPQFRGSEGFGYNFIVAGHGQWGRAMQDDLTDAVRHLANTGVVDDDRVCIFGWSYGGYATLAGAVFTPDVYRCAIAGAGIGDLYQMMQEEEEQFRGSSLPYWTMVLGADYRTNREGLYAISPARHVDERTVPTLIIHGNDELIVNYAQAETMAAALEAGGIPHELITIEGGVHHSYRMTTEQKRLMYSNLLRWLETYNPAD
ncbi:alpha/beta hydrolase family protein [Hyphobacterium marinum]|uniref:Alpha/beta fold hydrolase n=1 Tax=Hyphobacterium marinum TaxID=3116574 RepID=A0ABU7LWE8_9PROT|nr:alpha/beta fold hydrolase [Hyphobacterium sp. Y6023]MEE2565873.1 alpha/beta fold hydrolase [Hyphobacterium sp. Y6023]